MRPVYLNGETNPMANYSAETECEGALIWTRDSLNPYEESSQVPSSGSLDHSARLNLAVWHEDEPEARPAPQPTTNAEPQIRAL